jgi:triosephosphate isomerase
MLQRDKLVVGNWKMHGSLAENTELVRSLLATLDGPFPCRVAVCVPFPYFAQIQALLGGTPIAWGAQDVSAEARGAFTGQVAASMLRDFACSYAIVGHSERRALNGETSELVAEKAERALGGGLTPIVCVGESLAEREAGRTKAVVEAQLAALLERVSGEELGRVVLAYEPLWAIGTGRTASPLQAQEVHALLRAQVAGANRAAGEGMTILYGGSVKPANAAELFAMPDIDGGLIGGASLVAKDFVAIARACGAAPAR